MNIKPIYSRISFWMLLIVSSNVIAEGTPKESLKGYPRYLTGDNPSYLAWADDGEEHLEFSISVKYPLYGRDQRKSVFFSYSGDYDFYLFTRDSAPIVSRRQNPGIFFRHDWAEDPNSFFQRYRLGWFHESNGQTIETKEEYDLTENAQDKVSRGWDYLSLDLKHKLPIENRTLFLYTGFKYYCDCQAFGMISEREDKIFWEEVDHQPKISDFNGISAILSYVTEKRENRYALMVRTGIENSSNISYKVEAVLRAGSIPIRLFYFNGYGANLTTYHEHSSYVGIGFDFW